MPSWGRNKRISPPPLLLTAFLRYNSHRVKFNHIKCTIRYILAIDAVMWPWPYSSYATFLSPLSFPCGSLWSIFSHPLHLTPTCGPRKTLICCHYIFPLLEYLINGNIQYLRFWSIFLSFFFFGQASFTCQDIFEIHPYFVWISNSFYCWVAFHCMASSQFVFWFLLL